MNQYNISVYTFLSVTVKSNHKYGGIVMLSGPLQMSGGSTENMTCETILYVESHLCLFLAVYNVKWRNYDRGREADCIVWKNSSGILKLMQPIYNGYLWRGFRVIESDP